MGNIRVLVADDNLLAREGLCRLLEKAEDVECIATAENGKQAIELAREKQPDVAIIDVTMLNMNGIEATKELKIACPGLSILVVSAYKYDHHVLACIEAGADGYLLKDKMLAQNFINAIRTVYAGQSVFDREVTEIMRKLAISKGKHAIYSDRLGKRELEIVKLVTNGMSNKEIASELCISEPTVATHLANIFMKLQVGSRMEATLYALKKGWVSLDDVGYKQEK